MAESTSGQLPHPAERRAAAPDVPSPPGVAHALEPAAAPAAPAPEQAAGPAAPAPEPAAPTLREGEQPAAPGPTRPPDTSPAKPLLGSEALMDDLAPVEPARDAARLWCAALGLGFVLLGALPLLDLRAGGLEAAAPCFVLGGIALVAALTRVTYRQRAVAMVVLGLLSAAMGLRGAGPAMGISEGGAGWGVLRLLAAIILPAALLFRERYRAWGGARLILAAAFVCALPFSARTVQVLFDAEGLELAGAAVALVGILASLSGFMGANTTGAGSYMATGVIVALTAELSLHAFAKAPGHSFGFAANVVGSALAFAGTAVIAALGLFQVLAWRFAADARRIDIHTKPKEPSLSESGDWSTRG